MLGPRVRVSPPDSAYGDQMAHLWFKPRGYKHFDVPIGEEFAERHSNASRVTKNSWLPLICYTKKIKRYKPLLGVTKFKAREIMYASHRDACILSKYSHDLSCLLEDKYVQLGLSDAVIAYRKLGRSNYDFSASAYRFIVQNRPCVAVCYDISGFFDNLDHKILKDRLKHILSVDELSEDWYQVFRYVTRFQYVLLECLRNHRILADRLKSRSRAPIATIREIKSLGIDIFPNDKSRGIPQGTPISSSMSNLYMLEVDREMVEMAAKYNALYQRYSDDILIVCDERIEGEICNTFLSLMKMHKLEINHTKTDRADFTVSGSNTFQYLGFNIDEDGAVIRHTSLARQWRKARRSLRRIRKAGLEAMLSGSASKIYTSELRRRFQPIGIRNFSDYARRAAKAFGSKRILSQIRRFERLVGAAIDELNSKSKPP